MKKDPILGRRRIEIGSILLAVAFISMTFAVGVEPVMAADIVLPHYNVDGYKTTLVYVNKTAAALPADFAPGSRIGFPGRFGDVPAESVKRAPFNFDGAGVKRISVDEDLDVYVEIVTPVGGIIRRGPLEPVTSKTFYDLLSGDGWNSGVFIGSLDGSFVRVVGGAEAFIPPGGAVILPALSPVVSIDNKMQIGFPGATSGPLYAFAYSNHAVTYTLLGID